jgi:hypothetical protein
MTPAEALSHLTKDDPAGIVPAVYRNMARGTLRALVEEIGPDALAPATSAAASLAAPSVQTLLRRAIARSGRLCTPARRRVAFLRHYEACRTIVEAAARAGIDRRTVTRWRQASQAFDRRLAGIAADRRQDALDHALLVASRPFVRPVFYRGEKVGEYEVPNTALALYLLKQADREAERAESRRAEARPSVSAAATPFRLPSGETIEDALRRAERMRFRHEKEEARRREETAPPSETDAMSHPPGHPEDPAGGGPAAWGGDSMSHPPGHAEMSPSPRHRQLPREPRPGELPHCPDPDDPSTWWAPRSGSRSYVDDTPRILD